LRRGVAAFLSRRRRRLRLVSAGGGGGGERGRSRSCDGNNDGDNDGGGDYRRARTSLAATAAAATAFCYYFAAVLLTLRTPGEFIATLKRGVSAGSTRPHRALLLRVSSVASSCRFSPSSIRLAAAPASTEAAGAS